jgi:hypothetical protein
MWFFMLNTRRADSSTAIGHALKRLTSATVLSDTPPSVNRPTQSKVTLRASDSLPVAERSLAQATNVAPVELPTRLAVSGYGS